MKRTIVLTLTLSMLSAVLAGCTPSPSAPPVAPSSQPATAAPSPTLAASPTPAFVTLQYIGNACVLITAPDGTRIVSDPYDNYSRPSQLTRLPKDLVADAVTISHAHPDHNNPGAVGGTPQVITEPGTYQVGMVKITGYEGREGSPSGPGDMRENIIVFEIGGVKIVHLGDSGVITRTEVLAGIAHADLILVNIDGYVIPSDQIMPFMRQVNARTIMPVHYSLSETARWAGAPTIDEFLATLPANTQIVRLGSEIQVTPGMPGQVAVLTPSALAK